MDLLQLPVERFQNLLICGGRVAALFGALPAFGSQMVPVRLRAGLVVVLALLVFPVVEPLIPERSFTPIGLALLIGQEALLGVMVAFIAQLVFVAVEFGGTIIGYKMGFAAANVFDPQTQRQTSIISQFQGLFAMLIFLALDFHHLFLRAIVKSFQWLPPGDFQVGAGIPFIMEATGKALALGVQLSAPVIAVLLISGFALGILSRVFPQLNVFMLSFPLNIGLALVLIGFTLNRTVVLLAREFSALEERIYHLFQLM